MSTAVWTGLGGDQRWSDPQNWQNTHVPSAGDDVIFPAHNGNLQYITIDTSPTVNSLTLHGSYQFDGNLAFNLGNSVTEDVGQETFFALPVVLDNPVTLSVNGLSSSLIFDEGISQSTPGLGLTQTGTGLAVFSNDALTYTGSTDVNAGDFELATPSSSPIQIDAGASVYGAGGEAPSVSVSAGGTFTAGTNGITLDSGLTLASGSTLDADLTKLSNSSNLAPTTVTVNSGPIDLGGATLAVYEGQYTQSDSDSLTLIQNNTGAPVNGIFAGLPEGSIVTSIYRNYILSYEGGASGHDVTLTAIPGAADHLAFVGQPSSTTAADQSIATVVVDVEDANGSVVAGDNSSVSLSSSTSLGGTRAAQAIDGVATFSDVTISRAGAYTLTAADSGLTSAVSNSFTITPAAAAQLVVVQQPANAATVAQPIGTLEVAVEDPFGNIVTNDASDVSISSASVATLASGQGEGSVLTGTSTVATDDGMAVFNDLAFAKSGTYTLNATDGVLTRAATSPLTVAPAPPLPTPSPNPSPARVVVAGATVTGLTFNPATTFPQSAKISKILQFQVHSVASDGATIFSKTVRVRHGLGALRSLKIRKVGLYNVVISDSLGHSLTEQITVVAAAPAKLGFADPVNSVQANSTISVAVLDLYGNLSTAKDGTTVTLQLGPHPLLGPSPTLTGNLTATISDGVATFTNLAVQGTGRARLVAASGQLRRGRSGVFEHR